MLNAEKARPTHGYSSSCTATAEEEGKHAAANPSCRCHQVNELTPATGSLTPRSHSGSSQGLRGPTQQRLGGSSAQQSAAPEHAAVPALAAGAETRGKAPGEAQAHVRVRLLLPVQTNVLF